MLKIMRRYLTVIITIVLAHQAVYGGNWRQGVTSKRVVAANPISLAAGANCAEPRRVERIRGPRRPKYYTFDPDYAYNTYYPAYGYSYYSPSNYWYF